MADTLTTLGPIVYNVFVIMAFSMFLWKKNILSDIVEHTFIATGLSIYLVAAIQQIQAQGITPLMAGGIIWIIPIVMGLLLYLQFFKRLAFLQRWSMAIVIGVGMGILIRTNVETQILSNLTSSILPLTNVDTYTLFNNLIMITAIITTISYFIFTRPRKGVLGSSQKLGRSLMMIYFGASFGSFVMARLSMYIGILNTFLQNFGII